MKKLLTLLVFAFVMGGYVSAQGNGNFGNPNGNAANSLNIAQISWSNALKVLNAALPPLQQQISIPNIGQLISRYMQGNVTITIVATNPPTTTTYRVRVIGGGDVIVVLDE